MVLGAVCISLVKESLFHAILYFIRINWNHLPNIQLHFKQLEHNFLFHLLDVFKSKSWIKWESLWRFAIPVSLFISATDRKIAGSKVSQKYLKKLWNQFRNFWLIKDHFVLQFWNFHSTYYHSQGKHTKAKRNFFLKLICLKKIDSSHRSLNLEIRLVLWCAASDLKMEVIFMISIKNCLCQWSLELSKGVLNFFGTP